ncbi:MAG: MFS transporter [bacterium]
MQPNTRNLVAACAAITVFGLAFGMSYPLLSLILEARGVSSAMIGVNSSMGPLGILLASSVIPTLAHRFGSRRVTIIAAGLTAITLLCFKMFDTLEAWFVIRLIQGMCIGVLFALSEAWIVKYAENDSRGRVVAIYSSILSASFGAGPLLVGWFGIEGWLPFLIGAVVLVLGMFPLSLVQEEQAREAEEVSPSGILDFAPKAPMLLACVGVFAIFDAATLSLLPVYGIRNGLDLQTSAGMLSALVLGNVVLQFPIGWFADRFPKRLVLSSCALITAVFLVLLPFTIHSFLRWPVLILMGATGYGVYTVSLAALGDRFTGTELVNGSASFASMWGGGALVGSVTSGWALLTLNSHGLVIYLSITYFILGMGMLLRLNYLKRARAAAAGRGRV